MADPLSITSGVVGVLGFALYGAKRLYESIDSLRNAPRDIAMLSTDLRALHQVLAVLSGMQDTLTENAILCQCLKAPLDDCVDVFEEFTVRLHRYSTVTRIGEAKVRTWKNLEWVFKDKEIRLFRDTLVTYKASLDLAVGALTLSSTRNIDERTKRMEIDFKDDMKHIRSKLQDLDTDRVELVSTSGRRGSEWQGTDAGFALARFLDYADSICDSPPSKIHSSPVLTPSVFTDPGTPTKGPWSGAPSTESIDSFDLYQRPDMITVGRTPVTNDWARSTNYLNLSSIESNWPLANISVTTHEMRIEKLKDKLRLVWKTDSAFLPDSARHERKRGTRSI